MYHLLTSVGISEWPARYRYCKACMTHMNSYPKCTNTEPKIMLHVFEAKILRWDFNQVDILEINIYVSD